MRFAARALTSRLIALQSKWQGSRSRFTSLPRYHSLARASTKVLFISSLSTFPSFSSPPPSSSPSSSHLLPALPDINVPAGAAPEAAEAATRGEQYRHQQLGVSVVRSVGLPSLRDAYEDFKERTDVILFKARETIDRYTSSESGKTLVTITAINAAIYLMWKVVPYAFMFRHFSNSLESVKKARVYTLFTSNFSHKGLFHLVSNMYILNRFGHDVVDVLGVDRFLLFYATAGVASSSASLLFRRLRQWSSASLGASGAVVATLWLNACFFPDRRMKFIGVERTVTMQELVIAYTVFDAAGLLGSFGLIDFAAHLGGTLFANAWFYLVRDKLVEEHMLRKSRQYANNQQQSGFFPRVLQPRSKRDREYDDE